MDWKKELEAPVKESGALAESAGGAAPIEKPTESTESNAPAIASTSARLYAAATVRTPLLTTQ